MARAKTHTGIPASRLAVLLGLAWFLAPPARAEEMSWVKVGKDNKSFVLEASGGKFFPWGFNYIRDEKGRLLEDFWESDWSKVEADFAQMKKHGGNVVRVHLQLGKFMEAADKPNEKALARLTKLLGLAEQSKLYLDLTGLGCYHKQDVPAWYDKLSEKERWNVQARFWEAVAGRCVKSPAVFCYDLMNEPVSPASRRKEEDWLGPALNGNCFVQYISLDQKGRPRPDIARQWIQRLTAAVHKQDRRHLITVGLVSWSLDRKGLTSGFVPEKIVGDLDFISVHLYPEEGKVDEALKTLAGFSVGKPVLLEETAAMKCSLQEFDQFVEGSRKHACGWIGFYWSTPDKPSIPDAMMLRGLEFFKNKGKAMGAGEDR